MMNFYFKTAAGHVFVGVGKDVDRARSDAKRKAGSLWSPSAKCFKIGERHLRRSQQKGKLYES